MAIDAYMPFYGKDFFGALEGLRECAVSSYLRALWYYWHHTHCDGLPNDPERLRGICRCSDVDWDYVSPIVFGELFKLDGNALWQQSRSQEEYMKSIDKYESLKKAGRLGMKIRWGNRPPPPPKKKGQT